MAKLLSLRTSVAALAAVGIIGLASLAVLVLQERPVAADDARFDLTRGVLVTTRDRLRVCVEPGITDAVTATGSVERAISGLSLSAAAAFSAAGYDSPAWEVVGGCPSSGHLLASGQTHAKAGGTYAAGPIVARPSTFRLFVYVVSADDVVRMFGSLPFHHAGQETFCEDTQCATVTTALYVDAVTLANGARLSGELEQALGLRPIYPANPKAGNGPKKVP